MAVLIAVYAGLLGTAFGSFAGLMADRLPVGESVLAKRSHCSNEQCGRELGWFELVPVLSYLWLRGRCRACGVRIPPRLMFVEIGMGALFTITAARYGPTLATVVAAAFIALLFVISLVDWDRSLVLDKLTVFGTVFALLVAPIAPWAAEGIVETWIRAGLGATVGFLVFFPIAFLAPRWLGFGDAKLAGLIGAMVGFPLVGVALWSGVALGGIVGGALLASGVRKRGQHIPFGPCLAGGAVFTFLYGRPFLDWYLELLRTGF